MDTLMKADIFFFITSIAVIILVLLLIVVLIYVIRVMKNVDELSKKIKEEGSEILRDAHDLRLEAKSKAGAILNILSFAATRMKKKTRKHNDEE